MADDQINELVEVLISADGVKETESEMGKSVNTIKEHWTDALSGLDLGKPNLSGVVDSWVKAFDALKLAKPNGKDLFDEVLGYSVKLEPIFGKLDTSHIDEMIASGMDLEAVSEAFWLSIMDALRGSLPDEKFKEVVQAMSDKMVELYKPPVIPPPEYDMSQAPDITPGDQSTFKGAYSSKGWMKNIRENGAIRTGMATDEFLNSITEVQRILKDLKMPGLDVSSLLSGEGGGVGDLSDVLGKMDTKGLERAGADLTEILDRLNEANIHPDILEGITDQLSEYATNLQQATHNNDALNKKIGDTKKVGSETESFLGRYKYALLLIGGAVGVITGMLRYSSVFGTVLDLFGSSVGYLADVILFPLLPALLWFIELIIGLADWFNGLPGPVKTVISALLGLGLALEILNLLQGTLLFQAIKKGLIAFGTWLAPYLTSLVSMFRVAGLLMPLAFVAGFLLGMAGVGVLIYSGAANALSNFGQAIKDEHPLVMAALTTLFAPVGAAGAIFVDLWTGQWDRIPDHLWAIFEQVKAAWGYIGAVVLTGVRQIDMGLNNLLLSFGKLAQSNPLTKGIGDFMVKDASDAIAYDKKEIEKLALDKSNAKSAMEQWGNYARKGVMVGGDTAATPGSFMNGITYADQQKALALADQAEIEKIVKNTNQNLAVAGSNVKLETPDVSAMDSSGYTDLVTKYQKIGDDVLKLIDTQDKLNESTVTNTSISLDRIKAIRSGVNDLNGTVSQSINLQDKLKDVTALTTTSAVDGLKQVEKSVTDVNNVVKSTPVVPEVKTAALPGTDTSTKAVEQKAAPAKALNIAEQGEARRHELAQHFLKTQSKYKNDSVRWAMDHPGEVVGPSVAESWKYIGKSNAPDLSSITGKNYVAGKPGAGSSSEQWQDYNFSSGGVAAGLGLAGLLAWLSGKTSQVPITTGQKALPAGAGMMMTPGQITGNLPQGDNALLSALRDSQSEASPLVQALQSFVKAAENLYHGGPLPTNGAEAPVSSSGSAAAPPVTYVTETHHHTWNVPKSNNPEEVYQYVSKRLDRDAKRVRI